MKRILILFVLLTGSVMGQDLAYRVRQEILDQQHPVTVNVSLRGTTTLQFPATIQALESDAFTQKPGEEAGDFYVSPGVNWVSIRSLRAGAQTNLGVVLAGRVFELFIQTVGENDFSIIFRFARVVKTAPRNSAVWSPPLAKNSP
jgi:hypothetical protein